MTLLQGSPSTRRQLSAALQQVIVASVQAEIIRRRMAVRHPTCYCYCHCYCY
jgi:hypothetical protein